MAKIEDKPFLQNKTKKWWLNRTVLGVGLTSLFSDWSHETATAVLPAFLAVIGAGPAWLGAIEGVADGLSSFAKLAAGHYTDRLKQRKCWKKANGCGQAPTSWPVSLRDCCCR